MDKNRSVVVFSFNMNSPILLVCGLAALSAYVAAYNFQDVYYNQLLDDHFSAYDEALQWRQDRDLENSGASEDNCKTDHHKHYHHHHRHHHPCCGNFSLDIAAEKAEYLSNCMAQVKNRTKAVTEDEEVRDPFNCTQLALKKEKIVCVAECLGHKLNLFDENGELNESNIMGRVNETELEDWTKDHLSQVLETCLAKNKEHKKEVSPNLKCDMSALRFMHCVWKLYESRCPEEHQVHDKKCDVMREHLVKKKQH